MRKLLIRMFGRKYYANIINLRGTGKCEISCNIFRTKKEAEQHRDSLRDNRSYMYVETITFRSHIGY